MSSKHLSSQYHAELVRLSTRLLEMGGLVEAQVARAIGLLRRSDPTIFSAVIDDEHRINAMEREIDEVLSNVIARRQPAARDLRLLMATSKCTANLERAADEARKIGRRAERLTDNPEARAIDLSEVLVASQLALDLLRRALDAFARMDTAAAAQVKVDDQAIDAQFRAFTERMVPYMSANPRAIGVALDYMFVAKAVERIGDHAKNIAEFVIYVVEGKNVRHIKCMCLTLSSHSQDRRTSAAYGLVFGQSAGANKEFLSSKPADR